MSSTSVSNAASSELVPTSRIIDALSAAGLFVSISDNFPESIGGIADDSRKVVAGSAFIAVRGHAQDGHEWLKSAAERGACCAILEDASRTELPSIVVRDGRRAAAVASASYYDWPSHEVSIVGVTGTNGKTTTVGLLRHLLDTPSHRAASIGTLGVLIGSAGEAFPGGDGLTTPGPVELQRLLRALVAQGVRNVVMEVSSHSLDQRRVEGLSFAVGLFTNLTRDHLDYHGTMESYLAAKSRLIGLLSKDGTAVINDDDPAWRELPPAPHRITFGLHVNASVSARDIVYETQGCRFQLVASTGAATVLLPLIGEFNVANAVGAAAAAVALGVPLDIVATRLSESPQVPGRLEKLRSHPTVLRDYAHTPDSLERALKAVRPFTTSPEGAGRLIVVFGCGGDRDRGKRPVMGEIAERLGDIAIVTSDNPRTEDPERILDDIEAGMKLANHERIESRRAAIARALEIAGANDVILLAGKGHETYQIRGTVSHHFDEKEIVEELSAQ